MEPPLVLASASPRRRELLGRLGVPFSVVVADVDEAAIARGLTPRVGAAAIAREKARVVTARAPGAAVLAADTIVVLDGCALGKPVDHPDARRMLERLRGRSHEVVTAIEVVAPAGGREGRLVTTTVRMRVWTNAEAAAYVASGAPLDKAGGYGIQDEPFAPVQAIDGCWCNVVGLSLWATAEMLGAIGIATPVTPDVRSPTCAGCPLRNPAGASGQCA